MTIKLGNSLIEVKYNTSSQLESLKGEHVLSIEVTA